MDALTFGIVAATAVMLFYGFKDHSHSIISRLRLTVPRFCRVPGFE